MFNPTTNPSRRERKARDLSVSDAPAPVAGELCEIDSSLVLAGDIGGTNSRFRLFEVPNDAVVEGQNVPGTLVFEKIYPNEEFDSFESIVRTFFHETGVEDCKPAAACLAVAGPVDRNTVEFTNRDGWRICGEELAKSLSMGPVRLINDFVAAGYGLLTLDEDTETITLQDVPERPTRTGEPIACIGAGTGLGEVFLTACSNGVYEAWPTEGGHAEFAARNDLTYELQKFLKKKFNEKNRVSVERVVSGIGLANVYSFLRQAQCDAEGQPAAAGSQLMDKVVKEVDEEILNAGDQAGGAVAKNTGRCELCALAVDIMFSTYGAEAGVAALKWIPKGGLYIAGGIAPKNKGYLVEEGNAFMEAYYDKGRLSKVVKDIPVRLVLSEDIGQRGAQLVATRLLLDQLQNVAQPCISTTEAAKAMLAAQACSALPPAPAPARAPCCPRLGGINER
eukprot:CAMPEP_0118929704 /NCGR_PEP_ID=MMETSP1169-20130426/6631_1 /TAXON_ID=36882 /ORGANISM="Pyramimonas obovata, Strain CCMP722" /LENGTH=449 /DNA_ID=CAMNT_0006871951 /DNA_START=93 /DNA_END=1439 /DNA_ORIENTATION=-